METENCIDSDVSDSWSLLASGENEYEITLGIDAALLTALKPGTSDTNDDDSSLARFPPNETMQNVVSVDSLTHPNDNEKSLSTPSKDLKDFQVLYKGKAFKNDYQSHMKSSGFDCSKTSCCEKNKISIVNEVHDSDSTDSFSVISESESQDERLSPFESDENWDENSCDTNLPVKSHPNILKRKSKRLKLNYRKSSEESINNDLFDQDRKSNLIECTDVKKNENEFEVKKSQNAPVYRHYRNNVANTMLSMAMGVIFTGVAFIAVGHFLGVHDAQYTAGEMMATLERLQMENDLLHTRLIELSNRMSTFPTSQEKMFEKKEKLDTGKKKGEYIVRMSGDDNKSRRSWETNNNYRPKRDCNTGRSYQPENWFFKWSKSRERHRRNNKIGDFVFNRGKSWANFRSDDGMWQFRRAQARENIRI